MFVNDPFLTLVQFMNHSYPSTPLLQKTTAGVCVLTLALKSTAAPRFRSRVATLMLP